VFVSNRAGGVFDIYRKSSTGAGDDELLLKSPHNKLVDDWSRDGRFILYEETDPTNKRDLWLPMVGDRKPHRFLATPADERGGSFSPDGRWIAYESDETGDRRVFVRSTQPGGGKWQVSVAGRTSASPRWRADGKELFYDASGILMSSEMSVSEEGRTFNAGPLQQLFAGLQNVPAHNHDVVPDGSRFLIITTQAVGDAGGAGSQTAAPIVVVLNWRTGLKQ
jgi:Tol biopolymer transport system component